MNLIKQKIYQILNETTIIVFYIDCDLKILGQKKKCYL